MQIRGCRQGLTSAPRRQHDTAATPTTSSSTTTDRSSEAVAASDAEHRRLPEDARGRPGSADAAAVVAKGIDTIESLRSVRVSLSERAPEESRPLPAVDRTFRLLVRRSENDSRKHSDDALRRSEPRRFQIHQVRYATIKIMKSFVYLKIRDHKCVC